MKYFVILLILVGFSSLTIYVGSAQISHAITLGMSSEQILETQKLILLGHVDSVDTMQDRSEYTVSVLEYVKSSDTFEKNDVIKLVGCAEGQRGGCVTFEKEQDVLFVLDEKNGVLQVSELSFVSPNPRCTIDDLFTLHDARYGLEASQNNQTKQFFTGQPIDITFYAYNKQLDNSTYTVTVEFFRANNQTVFGKTFEGKFEECIPNVKLDTAFTPADMGRYGKRYTASYGGGEMSYGFPIVEKGATPLKQQSSGIPSNHILCNENLVLVQKYDDSPACVFPESIQKLVERGWIGDNIKNEPEITNAIESSNITKYVLESEFKVQRDIAKEIFKSLRTGEDTPYISFGVSDNRKSFDLYFDKTAFTVEKNERYYQEFIDESFDEVIIPINVIFVEGKGRGSGDE